VPPLAYLNLICKIKPAICFKSFHYETNGRYENGKSLQIKVFNFLEISGCAPGAHGGTGMNRPVTSLVYTSSRDSQEVYLKSAVPRLLPQDEYSGTELFEKRFALEDHHHRIDTPGIGEAAAHEYSFHESCVWLSYPSNVQPPIGSRDPFLL
jgi:hypothetical protein